LNIRKNPTPKNATFDDRQTRDSVIAHNKSSPKEDNSRTVGLWAFGFVVFIVLGLSGAGLFSSLMCAVLGPLLLWGIDKSN